MLIEYPTYLCGPMSGIPDFNYPAFDAAARDLRGYGIKVISPAEFETNPKEWHAPNDFKKDMYQVLDHAASITTLPGFENSYHGGIEILVAKAIGLPIYQYPTMEPLDGFGCVLLDARHLVLNNRQQSYGHPCDSLGAIATLWGAYTRSSISAKDAALMMCALKISRERVGEHKHDNLADAAGYIKTAQMIGDE